MKPARRLVWYDFARERWAAGDSSGRVLDAVMDRFEIVVEEATFSKLRQLAPEDFPARETKGFRRIAPRNGLHPDRKVRA